MANMAISQLAYLLHFIATNEFSYFK